MGWHMCVSLQCLLTITIISLTPWGCSWLIFGVRGCLLVLTPCVIVAEWSVVAASPVLLQPANLPRWSMLQDSYEWLSCMKLILCMEAESSWNQIVPLLRNLDPCNWKPIWSRNHLFEQVLIWTAEGSCAHTFCASSSCKILVFRNLRVWWGDAMQHFVQTNLVQCIRQDWWGSSGTCFYWYLILASKILFGL